MAERLPSRFNPVNSFFSTANIAYSKGCNVNPCLVDRENLGNHIFCLFFFQEDESEIFQNAKRFPFSGGQRNYLLCKLDWQVMFGRNSTKKKQKKPEKKRNGDR
ncbi:hypothetical protein I7I53_01194 [Histoplasma capsulatum var. duboisii H88]|uniref:Uncharacterized protein n=1 Tax=Ajellomyces capsulatus (strain H88) TaxID=544711 RepID=A0A8A1LPF2_AJEC8|nr:hypothetical protein I7I53_01194 [Histoplasma capsulatum var. duboisii H88]